MPAYRDLLEPTGDETAAALADYARMNRRLRLHFLVPAIVLTFLAGAAGGVAHGAGFLAFVRAPDGSYLVNKATMLVYTLLTGATVGLPSWILYRSTSRLMRARWRATAPSRFHISDEEADECAAMFR